MPLVIYVGAHDAVTLEVTGRDLTVTKGVAVDLPADLVGRAPEPRVAAAFAELAAAVARVDHEAAQALRIEIAGLDFGSGLLAQPDAWQPSSKPTKPAADAASPKDGE